MVNNQPALFRLKWRRREPDLSSVPGRPVPRFHQHHMITPVLEVRRERKPHVRFRSWTGRDRAVDEAPAAIEPARKQRSVFILWRCDRAAPIECLKVGRHRKRYQRAVTRIGRVGNRIPFQVPQPYDAGVLDTPDLFGILFGERRHRRCGVDSPIRGAVRAAGNRKVRRALTVFDAHQKKRLAIRELYGARIEDTVRGIRPMIGSKDRVIWMAYEEIVEAVAALDGGLRQLRRARFFGRGRRVPAPSPPHFSPDTPGAVIEESPI